VSKNNKLLKNAKEEMHIASALLGFVFVVISILMTLDEETMTRIRKTYLILGSFKKK